MITRSSALFSLFVLILSLSACTKCGTAQSSNQLPNSIKGMTLTGKIASGKGSFANNNGYSFSTTFETSQDFQSVNTSGGVESKGEYTYVTTGKDSATLTLSDLSGLHGEEKIEVALKFATPHSGNYVAKLLSGEQGEHSGTFELK